MSTSYEPGRDVPRDYRGTPYDRDDPDQRDDVRGDARDHAGRHEGVDPVERDRRAAWEQQRTRDGLDDRDGLHDRDGIVDRDRHDGVDPHVHRDGQDRHTTDDRTM